MGFTLIELIATIVVLAIILAITVPVITGIIKSSAKAAFESDAKLVLKAIDYKKLSAAGFDPTKLTKDNITEELGLESSNYSSVNFTLEENVLIVSIIGKDKWDGLITCGTFRNMKVVENASQCEGDSIPPVLTVLGDNPVNMYIGETYIDAGATATDNLAGNITDKIVITGTVNPNLSGSYTITYTVKDLFDNETTVTRTVNVIDNAFPIIDFNPNGNTTYAKTRTTTIDVRDLGLIDNSSLKYVWTLSDIEPQDNEFNTSFNNNQSITTPAGVSGSYYLWATAADTVGNVTTTRSNVFNLDNEKPVITRTGSATVNVNMGSTYTDAGATATDNIDTAVVVTTTGSVNPNIVGTYTITYNATDSSGNAATPVTRTINVIDIKAPVITITGSNPATVSGGGTYSDAGATAVDDVDGNVTSKITTTSNVNTNALGTYTVTYRVTDNAGNAATATRTVNVVDNILPTVTGATVPTNWASGNKTITVTGSDTGLSGIAGYYISTNSTKPTTGSAWTSSTSTTWTVSRGAGTYYIWNKDGAGNISSTYKTIVVTNIDANAPTVTAKGTSYTITEGASNVISSTYFNIAANGSAPISSTSCIDTSNGNVAVTNTSTLTAGTHVVRCTVTKATGLSANATTTIVVNPAYTGIGSGTYTLGQVVTYAGVQWNVMADNGTSVTLITKDILTSSQISSYAPTGFFQNETMGHCTGQYQSAPDYRSYCYDFSMDKDRNTPYYWSVSAIRKTVESWLNANSILVQAKNDGGLINMSFSDGMVNNTGYVRIITYNEALAAYNAGHTWHSNPNYYIVTITGTGSYQNGSRVIYYVNMNASTTQGMSTFYIGGWGGLSGGSIKPVIQVKK